MWRSCRVGSVGLALFVLASPLGAVTSTVQIALDTDGVATGDCVVATVDGPFAGVEHLLTLTIETANATGVVQGIERQVCQAGVFGAPVVVAPGTWPVGIGLGENGSHVVEAYVPLSGLGTSLSTVRFGIVHLAGSDGDALLLTEPLVGEPILLILQNVLEIPTVSQWGILVLLLLLAGLALRNLRRQQITAGLLLIAIVVASGWAWAVCVTDGQIDDWSSSVPLALDGADDAPDSVDLQAFWAKAEGPVLCLRVDTDLAFDQPPTANDDAFVVDEGSLDNSLDVLANDVDPEGLPLTIIQVGTPSDGGSVTTDGSTLLYSPAPTFVGTETFFYTVSDGQGGTDDAQVTVTVTPRCGNGVQEVLPQARAACPGLLYGATVPGPTAGSDLYVIDPATGVGALVGTIPIVARVSAMDFDPDGGLYGIGVLNNEHFLLSIDCATAQASLIGPLGLNAGSGRSITDMTFDGQGRLWVHFRNTSANDELGTVNRVTGAYTSVGSTTLADIGNGLASGGFPAPTILYHAGFADVSTLDLATGSATFVADLSFPPDANDNPRINGMDVDFASGFAFVSLNDKPAGVGATPQNFVASLDFETGSVALLANPPLEAPNSLDAIAVNRVYETCDDGTPLPVGTTCGGSCRLVENVCGDGLDNDFDGATDCEDADCNLQPCDDSDICTTNDTCTFGACFGDVVPGCGMVGFGGGSVGDVFHMADGSCKDARPTPQPSGKSW